MTEAARQGTPPDFGVEPRGERELVDAGWTRRTFAEPARVEELSELYVSLGFEVMTRALQPCDFGAHCTSCGESACDSYVALYVRRPAASS